MCFDADLLMKYVQRTTRLAHAKNSVWRPQLPPHVPVEFSELCQSHGANGVSVSTIPDAARVTESDITSVLVSLPPALSEITLIRRIPRSTELLLTIDHFVQAEHIVAHDLGLRTNQPVVILIQGDKPGPGIRPGQDALLMAQGVSQLPGIRIVGVAASVTENQNYRSVVKAIEHTQQQFRESDIGCDFVSVAVTSDAVPADNTVVTEIRDPTLLEMPNKDQPLVWLEAEVISRPSLEFAVLNVSQSLPETQETIWLPDFPEAQVSHRSDGCCLVTATGNAGQLKIGDVVRVMSSVLTRRPAMWSDQ